MRTGPLDLEFTVVLFHRLNGQPSLWDDHGEMLESLAELDVYAPEVPDGGRRSVEDESSKALLGRIVEGTNAHPGKPVAFFGQSNGTRLALLFEIWLRTHSPATPVHVSLSSAILYGTSTVYLANNTIKADQFGQGPASKINAKELALASDMARSLVAAAREPLADGVAERDYVMYSPRHDFLVPETGSGLPILVPGDQDRQKERHFLVTNVGHNALGTALVEQRIYDCLEWMEQLQKN